MKTQLILFSTFLFFLFLAPLQGQQLVYQPINSAFGGNYLNYNWLLSSANAQNPYDDADSRLGFGTSPLESFEDSVKRQVLNNLTRGMFGAGGGSGTGDSLEPGTYEVGGMLINIDRLRNGLLISIIDLTTGESTEIIL